MNYFKRIALDMENLDANTLIEAQQACRDVVYSDGEKPFDLQEFAGDLLYKIGIYLSHQNKFEGLKTRYTNSTDEELNTLIQDQKEQILLSKVRGDIVDPRLNLELEILNKEKMIRDESERVTKLRKENETFIDPNSDRNKQFELDKLLGVSKADRISSGRDAIVKHWNVVGSKVRDLGYSENSIAAYEELRTSDLKTFDETQEMQRYTDAVTFDHGGNPIGNINGGDSGDSGSGSV